MKAAAAVIDADAIAASLARPWESIPDSEKTFVLRTVDSSRCSFHTGWQWPAPGTLVVAPDWEPTDRCGYGLHGLLNGNGNHRLISFAKDAIGQVVQVVRAEIVVITADGGGKVKFPRCIEVFSGTLRESVRELLKRDADASAGIVPFAQVTDDRDRETIATPAGAGAASATGDRGAASATGYRGAASATGAQAVACARNESRARAGENGILILIAEPDPDVEGSRARAVVRYVGEGGIKAGVFYKLDGKGQVVESADDDDDYLPFPANIKQLVADRLAENEKLHNEGCADA